MTAWLSLESQSLLSCLGMQHWLFASDALLQKHAASLLGTFKSYPIIAKVL